MIQMIIMFCPFNMIVVNDDHLMWSQTAASWPVHVSVFPNVVPFSATMGTSATTSSWQQQENAKLTRSYEENMKRIWRYAKILQNLPSMTCYLVWLLGTAGTASEQSSVSTSMFSLLRIHRETTLTQAEGQWKWKAAHQWDPLCIPHTYTVWRTLSHRTSSSATDVHHQQLRAEKWSVSAT